jgi:hypothetical protein
VWVGGVRAVAAKAVEKEAVEVAAAAADEKAAI